MFLALLGGACLGGLARVGFKTGAPGGCGTDVGLGGSLGACVGCNGVILGTEFELPPFEMGRGGNGGAWLTVLPDGIGGNGGGLLAAVAGIGGKGGCCCGLAVS